MKFNEWLDTATDEEIDVFIDESFEKYKQSEVKLIKKVYVTEYAGFIDGKRYVTRVWKYDNGVYDIIFFLVIIIYMKIN